eukprot:scaffold2243_cov122-Cylindrotheca_fusiformis.AAC.8
MADIDAILDEALDELDNDESPPSAQSKDCSPECRIRCFSPKEQGESCGGASKLAPSGFHTLLSDFVEAGSKDNDLDEQINIFKNEVDTALNQNVTPPFSIASDQQGGVDMGLENLIKEMAKGGVGESFTPQEGDNLVEMLGLEEGLGGDFDSDVILDGMMEQLLSKDLMYEPMKKQVQEFGQPPREIIGVIAPGLELDVDGMPKINPMMGLGGNGDCMTM